MVFDLTLVRIANRRIAFASFKGSFISIKMEEWTPLPKIATKKLPKIVLEESIGIGVLAYDYITYLVAANPHSET